MRKDSRQLQLNFEGSLAEVGTEYQEQQEAPSAGAIAPKKKTRILTDKEALLERIVAKDNLELAATRVRANRGSAGIDVFDRLNIDSLACRKSTH